MTTKNKQQTQALINNMPASPLRVCARFSLEKAKRKLRNVLGKVPHIELPPEHQGYDTEIPTSWVHLHPLFPLPQQAPSRQTTWIMFTIQ